MDVSIGDTRNSILSEMILNYDEAKCFFMACYFAPL